MYRTQVNSYLALSQAHPRVTKASTFHRTPPVPTCTVEVVAAATMATATASTAPVGPLEEEQE